MKEVITKVSEVKKELLKALRYEDSAKVTVKVYDCDEDGEQTYDVEITYWTGEDCNEYGDTWVTERYYEGEEKDSVKRAKAVLKTVKGWFNGSESVQVEDEVEIYRG